MIEFGGQFYHIDFMAIDKQITTDDSLKAQDVEEVETRITTNIEGKISTETITRKYPKQKEIDGARYETINMMLSIILSGGYEMDDALGAKRALEGLPLNYKIAFNTLIDYGILVISE